jgi:hypothetical protein
VTFLKSFVLDTWAGLSHNAALGEGDLPPTGPELAPTWVGRRHHRRLQAYKLLAAYRNNVARWHLQFAGDKDRQLAHREYGDPELLVQQVRASLLGGTPKAAVPGADGQLPAEPTEDDAAKSGRSLSELKADWNELKGSVSDAVERQRWFDAQYTDERAAQKIIGCENNTVGLGDGVYVVSWSQEKQRVRVRTYDPGFYFDAPDDDSDDEFPNRVHLAWEFEKDQGDGTAKKFVRRITYERRPAPEWTPPYSDKPTRWRVYLTDATWALDDLRARHVDDFDLSRARYGVNDQGQRLQDYDLGIDFVPVVHVPCTIPESEGNPWGQSILVRVAQLLDDLARTDTDLATTSDLLGMPPIAVEGLMAPVDPATGEQEMMSYEPGQVWGGKVTVVDTSRSLDALLKRSEALFERLSVNRQVPQSVLGRVNLDNGRLAGITLMLSFGPFKTLINDMRLVREDKYRLLHRFWQRLAIVGGAFDGNNDTNGALPPGSEVMDVDLAFGPYLPTDLDSVKQLVVDLVINGVISKGTALRLLTEAGLDVGDLETEIKRARQEDFDGAKTLADATGSEKAAIDYLELDIEPPEPAAPVAPPGQPGPPPGQPPTPAGPGGPPTGRTPPAEPQGSGSGPATAK